MSDFELIEQLRKGDEKAYKQLFVKYYSPLCEYASQYISDEDVEGVVQELMLFVWETRDTLIIEKSLKSYLFIATKHRCLNAIKKKQAREQLHNRLYEKLKDQFEDPDHYLVNDLAEQIEKAIAGLPESYREVFVLSRFGAQTNSEIAAALGVSVKTVEYRISQSLKILRVKLKDYLPMLLVLLG